MAEFFQQLWHIGHWRDAQVRPVTAPHQALWRRLDVSHGDSDRTGIDGRAAFGRHMNAGELDPRPAMVEQSFDDIERRIAEILHTQGRSDEATEIERRITAIAEILED